MAVTGFVTILFYEVAKVDMIFRSVFHFILACAVGGMIVFGLYYLQYMFTEKYENSTSLVIGTPLIIGCVNTILGIGFLIIQCFDFLSATSVPDIYIIIDAIYPIGLYYFILVVPTSIGSIAISFVFYKKN